MSAALLIIDMLENFSDMKKCNDSIDKSIAYINATSNLFRQKKLPVVLVKPEQYPSEAYNPLEGLQIDESDIIIKKSKMNAFFKTELDSILKELGVDFVVISGMAAEYCVVFTYNGALECGYSAAILQNAVASSDINEVKNIQLLRPVISVESLFALL